MWGRWSGSARYGERGGVASHVSFLQVVGIHKPGGLQAGDVLISVQDKVVDRMTHKEVVNIIKGVNGKNLNMKIERGDHIIPNIAESFPIEEVENMRKVRKREYIATFHIFILFLQTPFHPNSSLLGHSKAIRSFEKLPCELKGNGIQIVWQRCMIRKIKQSKSGLFIPLVVNLQSTRLVETNYIKTFSGSSRNMLPV